MSTRNSRAFLALLSAERRSACLLPPQAAAGYGPPQTTRVATLDPWGFAKLIMQPQVQDHSPGRFKGVWESRGM